MPVDREMIADRLDQLVAAYNRHDADGVVGLFSTDGAFIDVDATSHIGRDAIGRDHVARFERSPGSWFEVTLVTIDRLTATAMWRRHRSADGSGQHDSWLGVDVIQFNDDGFIVTKTTYAKAAVPLNERVED